LAVVKSQIMLGVGPSLTSWSSVLTLDLKLFFVAAAAAGLLGFDETELLLVIGPELTHLSDFKL
jgi:hypothetical protein